MHVLFACHRYAPVTGGSERIAQYLAEAVVARGDRATMVTQAEPGVPSQENLHGVAVIRLPFRRLAGFRFPVGYLRTLRSMDADVFHVHGNRIWCADLYFPFARRFGWPQLVTGHGFYQYAMHHRAWDRWYFERYLPRRLRAFDYYVADTAFEKAQLVAWGVPAAKVPIVPLGAVLEEFQGPPVPPDEVRGRWGIRAPRIAVYVGGHFANKHVERLVEVIAATGGRWGLVVIGPDVPESPGSAQRCRELAASLGAEVRVLGTLPRSEVLGALYAADAVVSASTYEGFGVVLAEAMAARRPFVAWRAGAAIEMAEDGGGLVVDTVSEFIEALQRLDDTATARAMGERGGARADHWSMGRMAREYLALYDALASS